METTLLTKLLHLCFLRLFEEASDFIHQQKMEKKLLGHALQTACEYGSTDIAKFLIEKGADVHFAQDRALYLASFYGWLETVKLLVENGANVNAAGGEALYWASYKGRLEIVKFLVKNGANVRSSNLNCFAWADETGHYEVVKFLADNGGGIYENGELVLSSSAKKYISIYNKNEEKKRVKAANKIGSWWIPICYNVDRECGKRMMERSWKRVEAMYAERN